MRNMIIPLFLVAFVIGTDTFIVAPLLPLLRSEYGISAAMSGWLVSAYALGYALFALIAGPLSDNWNRKKVMTWGLVFFAVSTTLCGFADNFTALFVFRFLAGVSAAFTSPQIWALIPALFPAERVAKVMGMVMGGLSLSQVLGVPLGNWLATVHWSFPFYMIGACALLLALIIHMALPELKPASYDGNRPSLFGRYTRLLASAVTRRAFLVYFIVFTGFYAVFAFVPNWLSDHFHVAQLMIGTIMLLVGVGNLTGSITSGWLLERWGRPKVVGFMLCGAAATFVLLPFFSLNAVMIMLILLYFFGGVLVPTLMGYLQSLTVSERGTSASLANATMYAGNVVGSIASGFLYEAYDFFLPGIFAALCLLISSCLLAGKIRQAAVRAEP
ncbi:MFS transporter [Brevibacillus migulae]|uniref:MFS transporter n=1 Tax=Brevibacillus migulae TaxID=1644114 RepID=UPI00106E2D50|nr:MFS transporter [Brevibacillus migulae]